MKTLLNIIVLLSSLTLTTIAIGQSTNNNQGYVCSVIDQFTLVLNNPELNISTEQCCDCPQVYMEVTSVCENGIIQIVIQGENGYIEQLGFVNGPSADGLISIDSEQSILLTDYTEHCFEGNYTFDLISYGQVVSSQSVSVVHSPLPVLDIASAEPYILEEGEDVCIDISDAYFEFASYSEWNFSVSVFNNLDINTEFTLDETTGILCLLDGIGCYTIEFMDLCSTSNMTGNCTISDEFCINQCETEYFIATNSSLVHGCDQWGRYEIRYIVEGQCGITFDPIYNLYDEFGNIVCTRPIPGSGSHTDCDNPGNDCNDLVEIADIHINDFGNKFCDIKYCESYTLCIEDFPSVICTTFIIEHCNPLLELDIESEVNCCCEEISFSVVNGCQEAGIESFIITNNAGVSFSSMGIADWQPGSSSIDIGDNYCFGSGNFELIVILENGEILTQSFTTSSQLPPEGFDIFESEYIEHDFTQELYCGHVGSAISNLSDHLGLAYNQLQLQVFNGTGDFLPTGEGTFCIEESGCYTIELSYECSDGTTCTVTDLLQLNCGIDCLAGPSYIFETIPQESDCCCEAYDIILVTDCDDIISYTISLLSDDSGPFSTGELSSTEIQNSDFDPLWEGGTSSELILSECFTTGTYVISITLESNTVLTTTITSSTGLPYVDIFGNDGDDCIEYTGQQVCYDFTQQIQTYFDVVYPFDEGSTLSIELDGEPLTSSLVCFDSPGTHSISFISSCGESGQEITCLLEDEICIVSVDPCETIQIIECSAQKMDAPQPVPECDSELSFCLSGQIPTDCGPALWSVFDEGGELIGNGGNSESMTFDFSHLPSGNYTIQLRFYGGCSCLYSFEYSWNNDRIIPSNFCVGNQIKLLPNLIAAEWYCISWRQIDGKNEIPLAQGPLSEFYTLPEEFVNNPGKYLVTLYDCRDGSCIAENVFNIIDCRGPFVVDIVYPSCPEDGELVHLSLNPEFKSLDSINYRIWNYPEIFVDSTYTFGTIFIDSITSIYGIPYGDYYLTIKDDNLGEVSTLLNIKEVQGDLPINIIDTEVFTLNSGHLEVDASENVDVLATYDWRHRDVLVSTSPILRASEAGIYYVTVRSRDCKRLDSIVIENPIKINSPNFPFGESSIEVKFKNPAIEGESQAIFIQNTKFEALTQLYIFTLEGQIVKSFAFDNMQSKTINVNFESGVYIIKAYNSSDESTIKKLIVL